MQNYSVCISHSEYVQLNEVELYVAWYCGKIIRQKSLEQGLKDYATQKTNGADGERLQSLGELAKFAVAKALDLYPHPDYQRFKGADLEFNVEVRLIGVAHYGLRVRPTDDDEKRVVGIVIPEGGERKPYRIAGWIYAKDAKREEWKHDWGNYGRPVYTVPQNELHPISELRKIIAVERLSKTS